MVNDEIETALPREGMHLASIKKRSMAFFIDEMLLSLLLMIALWDRFSQPMTLEESILLTNTFVLEYMAMKVIYQAFFVMHYGASIGKLAMKIKVVEVGTLEFPNVLSALNRAIFRVVGELLFYLGFLWGVFDPARQAWHDKTAKTLVVDV